MVIANPEFVLNTEPHPVAGVLKVWGDVREDRKDEFVWEHDNCENRAE